LSAFALRKGAGAHATSASLKKQGLADANYWKNEKMEIPAKSRRRRGVWVTV
jgi:hypothetical protein